MGRIKTKLIKRVSDDLVIEHGHEFKQEFSENKELVSRFTDIRSKKMRNVIAGYVTRLVKTKD